jgi:hypothetical protein
MKREPLPKVFAHDGMELIEAWRSDWAVCYQGRDFWRGYRIDLVDDVKEQLGDLLVISPSLDVCIDVAAKIGAPS